MLGADFDETQDLWHIRTDPGGEVTARFLVNASGVLITPKLPDIDGVDSFAGLTMHTARWDHDQNLTGKRVAIIGTGASAVAVVGDKVYQVDADKVKEHLGHKVIITGKAEGDKIDVESVKMAE